MKLRKEQYNEFVLKGPLAIEFYCDLNELNEEQKKLVDDMYKNLRKYRETRKLMIKERDETVEKLINTVESLGIDNFTIYDDGDIEYNYKK